MKVVIEFHRVRAGDGARAKVGRARCDVIDTEAAIALAESLLRSLAMPQEPDTVTISDDRGNTFHRAMVRSARKARRDHDDLGISVWENEGGPGARTSILRAAEPRNERSSFNDNEAFSNDPQFPQ